MANLGVSWFLTWNRKSFPKINNKRKNSENQPNHGVRRNPLEFKI